MCPAVRSMLEQLGPAEVKILTKLAFGKAAALNTAYRLVFAFAPLVFALAWPI